MTPARRSESNFPWSGVRGIIFDMDNTLLESQIDYPGMKAAVSDWLRERDLLDSGIDLASHTTSTLIERTRDRRAFAPGQEEQLWALVAEWEERGMQDAYVEPDVKQALLACSERGRFVVLTNNAYRAARVALEQAGILPCFRSVYGREQAGALKPSPMGVRRILRDAPEIAASEWISIGDSWIDGAAAQQAGVPFVAYRASLEAMRAHGVEAVRHVDDLSAWIRECCGR